MGGRTGPSQFVDLSDSLDGQRRWSYLFIHRDSLTRGKGGQLMKYFNDSREASRSFREISHSYKQTLRQKP